MSDLERFAKMVADNAALQGEIAAIRTEGRPARFVVALAAKNGCDIADTEAEAVMTSVRDEIAARQKGEMPDADLDAVSGGTTQVRSQTEKKLEQQRRDLVKNWAG